jgi:hypothetical protein
MYLPLQCDPDIRGVVSFSLPRREAFINGRREGIEEEEEEVRR